MSLVETMRRREADGWTLIYWHRAWWWERDREIEVATVDPREVSALQSQGLVKRGRRGGIGEAATFTVRESP